MFNYLEAVKEDVKDYIENEVNREDYESREELEEYLYDTLWICDSVTGNGSGSYTFNREEARENVMGDTETVVEALKEFCTEPETIAEKFLSEDWEYFDVAARCYALGSAISSALDEIEAEEQETA